MYYKKEKSCQGKFYGPGRIFYFRNYLTGRETTAKMLEDMRNEAAQKATLDTARETAERLIKKVK